MKFAFLSDLSDEFRFAMEIAWADSGFLRGGFAFAYCGC